jgi:hypothetical protein
VIEASTGAPIEGAKVTLNELSPKGFERGRTVSINISDGDDDFVGRAPRTAASPTRKAGRRVEHRQQARDAFGATRSAPREGDPSICRRRALTRS